MSVSKHIVSKVKIKPLVDALMVEIRNGNLKTDPRFIYSLLAKSQGAQNWKAFASQKNLHDTWSQSTNETQVAVDVLKIELDVMELSLVATQGDITRRETMRFTKTKNPLNNGWSTSMQVLSQPSREGVYLEFLGLIASPQAFVALYEQVEAHAQVFLEEVLIGMPEPLLSSYSFTPNAFANTLLLALNNKPTFFVQLGAELNRPKLIAQVDYPDDLASNFSSRENPLMLTFGYDSYKRKIFLSNAKLVEQDLNLPEDGLLSIAQITGRNMRSNASLAFALGCWAVKAGMRLEAFPAKIEDILVQ